MRVLRDESVHNAPIQPIYLMVQEGVEEAHVRAVLEATQAVLRAAGVAGRVEVHNLGAWQAPGQELVKGKPVAAWRSLDWYLAEAREASEHSGQLHGGHLLRLLYNEPWQRQTPHYDIVLVREDIYDDDCDFCIGLAVPGLGTVISTARFQHLDPYTQRECIVTETMHEVGHVFGLIPDDRTDNVEDSLGLHCTNRCIMRQGLNVPHDWLKMTSDRLAGHGFCPTCQRDLRQFFCQ